MTDDNKDSNNKLSLGASGQKLQLKRTIDAGKIRQTFSHGRSKDVLFEVKKSRSLDKNSLAEEKKRKIQDNIIKNTGLSDSELANRVRIIKELAQQQKLTEKSFSNIAQDKLDSIQEERVAEINKAKAAKLQIEQENIEAKKEKQEAPVEKSDATKEKKELSAPVPSVELSNNINKNKNIVEEEGSANKKSKRTTLSIVKREKHKLKHYSIESALEEDGFKKISAIKKKADEKRRNQAALGLPQIVIREVIIPDIITVQELSNRMAVRCGQVIKKLMSLEIMATANQDIDGDTAELVVTEFGHNFSRVSETSIEDNLIEAEGILQSRPPVVTVMGHVDHGKTSLLDSIRKSDVVSSESGGITQHIGAYQVTMASGHKISFIDTPGHAAFSEMRSRGANVTDIVILVVAADDGIKEQTEEAISHAKAANVPIIVAINKIDRPQANSSKIKNELLSFGIVSEEMGGDVQIVEVSALQGTNIDKLEEAILLQAEILELQSSQEGKAIGTVIESRIDKGKGVIVTVLIQRGTLKIGDVFVAGTTSGKVKAISDDKGRRCKNAFPADPVEILGFSAATLPGESFIVVTNESNAREIAEYRIAKEKQQKNLSRISCINTMIQHHNNAKKVLCVIIKADVRGSAEALINSLQKIEDEEVEIKILHSGVGGINDGDVVLASTANALVVGFNVRARNSAVDLAQTNDIKIMYYSVIYDAIDAVKQILSGLLVPEKKEKICGYAEIREVFSISRVGKISGCYVNKGEIVSNSKLRLLRDNIVIYTGEINSLKRFKDDIKVAKEGYECGIAIEGYQDIKVGDTIECFVVQEIKRTLANA